MGALVLGDLLMMGNILPRQFAFLLAAVVIAYVLGAKYQNAIALLVAHIPFSPALPVPGFDSLALWRLVIIAFIGRLLWAERKRLTEKPDFAKLKSALKPEDWIGLAFFVWATLSLLAATDLVAGLRKLVFLGNAALLYMAIRWLAPRVLGIRRAVLKGLFTALFGLLLFGTAQYLVIEYVSLYDFWQGWSLDVIPVFYGEGLAQTLNVSNTWFAYYPPPTPPTLRMFSLLPDSHSFSVTMLLGFLLSLAAVPFTRCQKHRIGAWGAAAAFGVAIFVNGSRGIWVAAVPTALLAYVVLMVALRRNKPVVALSAKTIFLGFLLLTLLFPVSSYVSAQAHGTGIDSTELDVAFRRAQSILDLDEVSNRGRIGIWITNAKTVAEHPILGVGIGNAAVALGERVSSARQGASAHNLYLDFAVETGVFGGLLVLFWFLMIFSRSSRNLLTQKLPQNMRGLGLVLTLSTAWLGVYNLVDIVFINDRALLAFFALLAIVVSAEKAKPVAVIHA